MAAADLVWSHVFRTFPSVKVALSEGGTGWVPYFLDRLDRTYEMHHAWTGQDFGGGLPSDVFKGHFMTCFIADPSACSCATTRSLDMAWEMDYPHSDSSWPAAPEEFAEMADRYGVQDDEIDAITHRNAMELYQFDPYGIRIASCARSVP